MKLLPILTVAALSLGAALPTAPADEVIVVRRGHHKKKTVYVAPRRVYVAPPVYVAPRPVYVEPRPVYVAPRPVYVAPRPVEVDVQRALAKRGYYGGVIDGDIGPRTRAAIRTYQVDKGLPVTGVIDGPLLRSLRLL